MCWGDVLTEQLSPVSSFSISDFLLPTQTMPSPAGAACDPRLPTGLAKGLLQPLASRPSIDLKGVIINGIDGLGEEASVFSLAQEFRSAPERLLICNRFYLQSDLSTIKG